MDLLDREPWWKDESGPRNPFGPNGRPTFTKAAVAVKCIRVVEGRGDFPVDMLRYDRAFCMTPIPHPDHPWFRTYRVVVGFTVLHQPKPTEARWGSFGWSVIPALLTDDQISLLKARVRIWRSTCHRCHVDTAAYAMSWFASDLICSVCEEEERKHPDFNLARNTMRYSFLQGDYDYQGIGWPGPHGRHP
jgi:hypothetical protein